jgi:large conductance mechanosensitive channel
MISALYFVGAIVFIISVIAGFLSGSFWGFVIAVVGGIASTIIFFALANILEKQNSILYRLQNLEEKELKNKNIEKKICLKCNYKYDTDYSSCPHCGYRE